VEGTPRSHARGSSTVFDDSSDGSWEELDVSTSPQGQLSVRHHSASATPQGTETVLADNACQDSFQPPITLRQTGTLNWFFNLASAPDNIESGVYPHIRAGANNVSNNFNNCGVADTNTYSQADAGTTTSGPNIDSNGNCTTTDNRNVFAFGAINPTSVLAVNCAWYDSLFHIVFDDQRFDTSGTSWTLTPLSGCAGSYDVQSVATHEHGHAAGMEHANETDHPWLTMSTSINGTCQQSERTFAFGEANAWNVFY
jgi:hypothetical protein